MNKKRLLELADFMETVPRKKFDMATFGHSCGTTACALGWAATKPHKFGVRRQRGDLSIIEAVDAPSSAFFIAAEVAFELNTIEVEELFNSGEETPKQWAKRCRKFVRKAEGAK